jgi:hypothetical protein
MGVNFFNKWLKYDGIYSVSYIFSLFYFTWNSEKVKMFLSYLGAV